MNVEIVYDSSTGTTKKAAEAMGRIIEEQGHACRVQSVKQVSTGDMANADLICVGSWVQGLFIILQHPTEAIMQFIDGLGDLSGKQAVVFCTYKLASGGTMRRMANALEQKGATVAGQFKYRGPDPSEDFVAFAKNL